MTDFYKFARPLMRGVRVDIRSGQVGENVKNRMARDMLSGLPAFTGELVVGRPTDISCRERTEEFLNDEQLMLPFIFWVYDMKTTNLYDLRTRLKISESMVSTCPPCIQYVDHTLIQSKEELDDYAKKVVVENYFPGIVLREPFGTFGMRDEEFPAEGLGLALQ